MKEDGNTPLDTVICGRCATACDLEDNFCRHCGLPLHEQQLPSVRDDGQVPAVWQPPLPPAVVKGVAFVAAGTLAEVLLRRLVRGVLRRQPRASQVPARQAKGEVAPLEEPVPDDTQMVSETFLLRRVRFRR